MIWFCSWTSACNLLNMKIAFISATVIRAKTHTHTKKIVFSSILLAALLTWTLGKQRSTNLIDPLISAPRESSLSSATDTLLHSLIGTHVSQQTNYKELEITSKHNNKECYRQNMPESNTCQTAAQLWRMCTGNVVYMMKGR